MKYTLLLLALIMVHPINAMEQSYEKKYGEIIVTTKDHFLISLGDPYKPTDFVPCFHDASVTPHHRVTTLVKVFNAHALPHRPKYGDHLTFHLQYDVKRKSLLSSKKCITFAHIEGHKNLSTLFQQCKNNIPVATAQYILQNLYKIHHTTTFRFNFTQEQLQRITDNAPDNLKTLLPSTPGQWELPMFPRSPNCPKDRYNVHTIDQQYGVFAYVIAKLYKTTLPKNSCHSNETSQELE